MGLLSQTLCPGAPVYESAHAVRIDRVWTVEPMPIRKRRRGWRAVLLEIQNPTVFMVNGCLYVHPALMSRLKQEGATND